MANVTIKQHEQLRVPAGWTWQSRDFVIQLSRILDDIYIQLGKIEQRLNDLESEEEE